MKSKPLIETNPHLRDQRFRKALIRNVASSTAIETGASVESSVRMLEGKRKDGSALSPRAGGDELCGEKATRRVNTAGYCFRQNACGFKYPS